MSTVDALPQEEGRPCGPWTGQVRETLDPSQYAATIEKQSARL